MDHGHTPHSRRGAKGDQRLARHRRNLCGSRTIACRQGAEGVGQRVVPDASSSGAAGGSDRAQCSDCRARDEESEHEPADEPEGRLGIVEEPAAGDQRGGSARPVGHEPSARRGEPGSGQHQSDDKKREANEQFKELAAIAARLAGCVEVGEHADPGEKRNDPEDPRRGGGRPSTYAERRNLDAAQRQACGHDRGDRDADHNDCDVDPLKREVPWSQRRTGEGDVVEEWSKEKEHDEAKRHSGNGRNCRLHGRDHRDLPRGGTYEAHGGEALLSPGGGQPAGGGDQDEHRQEQGDRSDGQDPLQHHRTPHTTLAGIATGRRVLDASDLDRTWVLRELVRVVTDDDDQRVGGREACSADGPDLASGEPVGELVRRCRRQQALERWRGVVLPRSWQVREPWRHRRGRPRGGDIDPVDGLVAELIDAEQPPQRVRRRGARRRGSFWRGVQPSAALVWL